MKRNTRRILAQERARKGKPDGVARARAHLRSARWPWLLAALLLMAAGVLLSWRIELLAARYQLGLQTLAGSAQARVRDLGRNAVPGPQYQGDMVRVVGVPQVIESPLDAQFNQSAPALQLRREVDMFQWQQVDLGQPLYELEWQQGRVDSAAFARPSGHENPSLPLPPATFVAPRVRLDGFVLAPQLVQQIPGWQPMAVDAARLPANLEATFMPYDGALYSGDPRHPSLGEIRIHYVVVMPQLVTVIARVHGGALVPAADASVQLGDRSLGDVLPQLPPRPLWQWPSRLLAWLLAVAGVALLLRWRERRLDAVQVLAGGAVLVLVPAIPVWLHVGWLIGGVLLLALLLALALLVWRLRSHARA